MLAMRVGNRFIHGLAGKLKCSKKFIHGMLNVNLSSDSVIFLLSILDSTLSATQKYTSLNTITSARILCTQKWKLEDISTEKCLMDKLSNCIEIDKIS